MTKKINTKANQITRIGIFDMQVCVRDNTSDEIVERFANLNNPSGAENGWKIRRTGDPLLCGSPERMPCAERQGFVHIMLDC